MTAPRLRIGTRGSPLALAQTELVAGRSRARIPSSPRRGARGRTIRTTGDRVTDRPLAELGGKGLFCKEIEAALLARRIDFAVHSLKDLPTWLPDGLIVGAVLEREDPRDVLIARPGATIAELPEAAVIGTSSVRRKAQLLARRPDLRVVDFRGNVETRLRKLAAGEVDATLLALAGLRRLGIEDAGRRCCARGDAARGRPGRDRHRMPRRRCGDASPCSPAIDHPASAACVRAERALLAALDGSCHTPIAGHAEIAAGAAASARAGRPARRQRVPARRAGRPARRRPAARPGCRRRAEGTRRPCVLRLRMHVLITRPREQALELADRLAARGDTALIEPLLTIERVAGVAPRLDGVQALVLTSANAAPALGGGRTAAPVRGRRRHRRCRPAGRLRHGDRGGGLGRRSRPPDRAALPAGGRRSVASERRGRPRRAGRDAGRRRVRAAPAGRLQRARAGAVARRRRGDRAARGRRGAAVIAAYRAHLRRAGRPAWLQDHLADSAAICLSTAVAQPCRALVWRAVHLAARPAPEALLEALEAARRRC